MPTDHIRLSAKAKDHLVTLKRRTGIEQWNILCRWAFCASLATKGAPPDSKVPADSNIEMDWKTFGGQHSDLYWAMLLERCQRDGIDLSDNKAVAQQFRLHLHRGIQYLAADKKLQSIAELVDRSLTAGDRVRPKV